MPGAPEPASSLAFLARGGTMASLIRDHDWSSTPVGPATRWPRALKTAIALMLEARQPAYVAWGPEQTSFYNDGYIPILGSKHPDGLGLPARELWSEIWDTLGPINAAVLSGEAQWFEDMPFALAGRNRDVSWFSFSYTPILDDEDRIAGIFCAATETTEQVLAAQQAASERERLTRLFHQAPSFMALLEGPQHRFAPVNPAYERLVGGRQVVQLQSFSRLFLVFAVAPLALIGVVMAMLPSGAPLGFVAILGVLALIGILVRNSVILIVQIEDLKKEGRPAWDAVVEATEHRMRPILLTAAAASLALIPIAREIFWGPMAYAMMGGIIVGTLLTLLFLPALYVAWFRIHPDRADETPSHEPQAVANDTPAEDRPAHHTPQPVLEPQI
jgi:PAS domain-containing protein